MLYDRAVFDAKKSHISSVVTVRCYEWIYYNNTLVKISFSYISLTQTTLWCPRERRRRVGVNLPNVHNSYSVMSKRAQTSSGRESP